MTPRTAASGVRAAHEVLPPGWTCSWRCPGQVINANASGHALHVWATDVHKFSQSHSDILESFSMHFASTLAVLLLIVSRWQHATPKAYA